MKRVGVDVGGTFTDLIYVDDEAGEIRVHKLPTTPGRPVAGHRAGHPGDHGRGRGGPSVLDRSSTGRRSRRTS